MPGDIADRAQALNLAENDAALAAHTSALDRARPARHAGRCDECGDLIPSARIAALPRARLCVGCQEASDSLTRLYARPRG